MTRLGLPELTLSTMNVPVMHFTMYVDPYWMDREDSPRSEDPFDLDAPYQRGAVWTVDRRRNLIRSLLMKLPIGAVTVAKLPYDRPKVYRVLDGKQRVETLRMWVNGGFAVPADWFHDGMLTDPDKDQVTHLDLSDWGRRAIEGRTIGLIEFNPVTEHVRTPEGKWGSRRRTEAEMLTAEAELYLLLNFGGVEHTAADRDRAAAVASGGTNR